MKGKEKAMQELILELSVVIALSFFIGLGSSMVGISGGAFKTPMLIIIFGLTTQFSTAVSLFSALFLAIPSSIQYYRYEKDAISVRIAFIIAAFSVPGSIIGVLVKSMIVDDYILKIIFGVSLLPVAIVMMLTKRKSNGTDSHCSILDYDHRKHSMTQWIFFSIGSLIAGFVAGLLGLGGGTVAVPLMCIVLGMPILMAAATSVFAMIFTASVGTIMNYAFIAQTGDVFAFLFYSLAIGIGTLFGSQIGPKYACRIDGVLLRRIFGAILVFPLIHMMDIGGMLLNPNGGNYLISTLGDVLVWLVIISVHGLIWFYWHTAANHSQKDLAQTDLL